MSDDNAEIPSPKTPAEVGIHVGYLRRDISDLKKQQEKDMSDIKKGLADLGAHFVSIDTFTPVAAAVVAQGIVIEDLKTFKDNLTGKLAVGGIGISILSSVAAAILVHWLGG